MQNSIGLIYTKDEINNYIMCLGDDINKYCYDNEIKKIHLVGITKACFPFLIDLMRYIDIYCEYDVVDAKSYKGDKQEEDVVITYCSFEDKKCDDVLVVDTLCDTGKTLIKVVEFLNTKGITSIKTCVLFKKEKDYIRHTDFTGTFCPDVFVVGYGLDYNGKFRELTELLDFNYFKSVVKEYLNE